MEAHKKGGTQSVCSVSDALLSAGEIASENKQAKIPALIELTF